MGDNLASLGKHLSQDFHIIVPDLINHGKSPHRANMGYPSMADDVIQLLDILCIPQFHLVGHSMGGKVAMQIAGVRGERVSSLAVVDISPVQYPNRHSRILEGMQATAKRSFSKRRDADEALSRYIDEVALRQFFLKNMSKTDDGSWRWAIGIDELINAYSDIADSPTYDRPYNGPSLFIKGELSDYILESHRDAISRRFPNISLKIIQGAGHWVHSEKPAMFNTVIDRWLNSQSLHTK
ncbi:Esterase YbfF [BD1-7 clade bacterium]|uniref:Esterase YbfF n=1 Tax=BD1-7 clade bacterium TaxID=2029982 RepID=A0A5S9QRQ0_9GAMM|nr:Esterase YbfF [BD1-7 clade bacterium]CAA0120911.1 Esterase YbfF [BD1-7 clade bacterium]